MFAADPGYGPFANLVGTVGAIMATAGAIALGWRRRSRWEPSEEDVSKGPQRVGSLVAAVGIVLIWANSRPDHASLLTYWSIWLAVTTVFALLVYGLLNSTMVYYIEVAVAPQETKEQKIIGGFWFEQGIPEKMRAAGVTTQDFLKGTGYKVDAVWPRIARGLAKQTFVLAYLALTVAGTLALTAGAVLVGFKTHQ